MEQLHLFSASSANNDSHQHLWLKGASLFIPQINKLLEHTNYAFNVIDIQNFQNNNSRTLGEILAKNGSDKSTVHDYHILYSFIFNKIGENSNIFEVGLGTNNPHMVSSMGSDGRPGASLYSFKEYLPNSNIYGADIDKNILFQSDGIKTCFVDQLEITTFENLINVFGKIKYDLIIDDGLHSIGANFNTLLFALENLNENGWIVIEDIEIINNWKSIDFIIKTSNKFKTYIIRAKGAYLYVINKL